MRTLIVSLLILCGAAVGAEAQTPMDARVTINYRDAQAETILSGLARGAAIPLQIENGWLQPVTIALTQVKLSNALNALCDTAHCVWTFDGTLHVTPRPEDRPAVLPAHVSITISDGSALDAIRAIAEALGLSIVIDPRLPSALSPRGNWNFVNASTGAVLDGLCRNQCAWTFENGIVRLSPRP